MEVNAQIKLHEECQASARWLKVMQCGPSDPVPSAANGLLSEFVISRCLKMLRSVKRIDFL